jgi:hypothetical protein
MIKNTFVFIPGIGEKTEEAFWKKGILTWDDFKEKSSNLNLNINKKRNIEEYL